MDFFVVVAVVGIVLLVSELLLPTGGVLAVLGALGLVAAGVIAEAADEGAAWVGPALIALGVLAAVSFFVIARKVLAAHRDEPVRTGSEELVGASAEARTTIDPEGQVWIEGALWRARLAGGGGAVRLGDRVRVDAVEGLTLVVRPESTPSPTEEGAS